MSFTCGLDWGGVEHALCVVDDAGQRVAEFKATHDMDGLARMLQQLRKLGSPEDLPIAIERPSGLLVDTLVNAGHPIVPIHPNVAKACRSRYRAVPSKSDPSDAYLLADVLRTDGHRFQALQPLSDAVRALRALVRSRDDLIGQRIANANQLRALLQSYWPGAAVIFSAIDSPIALEFVKRYPTPAHTNSMGEKRLASFLARCHYSGCRSPKELLARLRAAPTGLAGEIETCAKAEIALGVVAVLEVLVGQIQKVTSQIQHDIAQLSQGRIVMSFPRAGRVNAAQILAEIGDPKRFASADQLAAECGVVPVTYESGKRRGVGFRWACNKRLKKAITTFADNSRHACPWAADIYQRARSRGCRHPHAVRILARSWTRVLWRALDTQTNYDPTRHGGACRFAAV